MTRVLFSAKIPHRPPTHCLPLSVSFSLVCSVLLLAAFCTEFHHQVSVHPTALCYDLGELGQPVHELDQVVTENKER